MEPQQRGMQKNGLLWLVCIALVIAVGTGAAFTYYTQGAYKEITLNDDGYIAQIQTTDETVGEMLDEYEIKLGPGDEITPGLEETIEDGIEIKIHRAFKVTVAADGRVKTVYLTKGTIEDVIYKALIVLGQKDFINYPIEREALPGDHIRVTRVKEEVLIEKETIPYRVITEENKELNKGTEKLVQEGQEGQRETRILVAYHDGIEINREVVEEKVSKEPMNRIIAKGTYVAPPISRGDVKRDTKPNSNKAAGNKTNNKSTNKKVTKKTNDGNSKNTNSSSFVATAYTHTGNKTRTGVWPKEGMIAVDPRVIALGSKVYVEFSGKWSYLSGYYRATDTGGAIKGNKIDVFMNDGSRVTDFGIRTVKVSH